MRGRPRLPGYGTPVAILIGGTRSPSTTPEAEYAVRKVRVQGVGVLERRRLMPGSSRRGEF